MRHHFDVTMGDTLTVINTYFSIYIKIVSLFVSSHYIQALCGVVCGCLYVEKMITSTQLKLPMPFPSTAFRATLPNTARSGPADPSLLRSLTKLWRSQRGGAGPPACFVWQGLQTELIQTPRFHLPDSGNQAAFNLLNPLQDIYPRSSSTRCQIVVSTNLVVTALGCSVELFKRCRLIGFFFHFL